MTKREWKADKQTVNARERDIEKDRGKKRVIERKFEKETKRECETDCETERQTFNAGEREREREREKKKKHVLPHMKERLFCISGRKSFSLKAGINKPKPCSLKLKRKSIFIATPLGCIFLN